MRLRGLTLAFSPAFSPAFILAFTLVFSVAWGCTRPAPVVPGPEKAGFSGEAALAELSALLELPRALGDPRRGEAVEALAARLRGCGAASVDRLGHTGEDPWTGRRFAMTTLIANFRPEAPRRFLLATHFDTRPWAEEDPDPQRRELPIPGANDGTSGVAVLLTLAPELLQALAPEVGFSVVLFDGEELGRPPAEGYCAGSRALAAALAAGRYPWLRAAAFAVVIDMIGDADLEIAPEGYSVASAPWLVDAIWGAAAAAGEGAFVDWPGCVDCADCADCAGCANRANRANCASRAISSHRRIIDDHLALAELGIPAVLVIDRAYAAWHTHADTLDRVSARSLGAVGEVLRRALLGLSAGPWPPGPPGAPLGPLE